MQIQKPNQQRTRSASLDRNRQLGVSTVEYIIVLVLIAVACIAMWSKFGKTVHAKIKASEDQVSDMETNLGK